MDQSKTCRANNGKYECESEKLGARINTLIEESGKLNPGSPSVTSQTSAICGLLSAGPAPEKDATELPGSIQTSDEFVAWARSKDFSTDNETKSKP